MGKNGEVEIIFKLFLTLEQEWLFWLFFSTRPSTSHTITIDKSNEWTRNYRWIMKFWAAKFQTFTLMKWTTSATWIAHKMKYIEIKRDEEVYLSAGLTDDVEEEIVSI